MITNILDHRTSQIVHTGSINYEIFPALFSKYYFSPFKNCDVTSIVQFVALGKPPQNKSIVFAHITAQMSNDNTPVEVCPSPSPKVSANQTLTGNEGSLVLRLTFCLSQAQLSESMSENRFKVTQAADGDPSNCERPLEPYRQVNLSTDIQVNIIDPCKLM